MQPPTDATPRRSALATLGRALLFTIAGILGAALLILLGLGALNSFDQRELPATRAALALPENPTPDDRNLYFAMAGFDAPPGESLVAVGKARIARYDAAIDSQQDVSHVVAAGSSTSADSGATMQVGAGIPCSPLDSPLWTDVQAHTARIMAAAQENRALLERYSGLHAFTGYFETARPSYLAPSVKIPGAVRCLYLAATAAALQSADASRQIDAARNFAQDISMWRTVLVGYGTVLSKMQAANELHADLRLAASACADAAVSATILEALGLQPFDLKDWRLGTAFAAEFRAVAYIYRQLLLTPAAKAYARGESAPQSAGLWQRLLAAYESLFFKYDATMNLSASRLRELIKSTDAEAADYEAAHAAFERWSNEHVKANSLRSLYNPTGRILVALASGSTDYQMRAYDYAALQRMVFLAYQLRTQDVAGSDVHKFMAMHPQWSTHPVNGRFFAWNPAAGTLSMTPLGSAGVNANRYAVSVVRR